MDDFITFFIILFRNILVVHTFINSTYINSYVNIGKTQNLLVRETTLAVVVVLLVVFSLDSGLIINCS